MYDLIIIGLGPSGMTAGIYSAVYKIKTLIIGEKPGGYAIEAFQIKNYPGVPDVSGIELMDRFKKQLDSFRVPIKSEIVINISKNEDNFNIKTNKNSYLAKAIIIASGTERKKLHIEGEKEFMGRGVAYCATCDAFLFNNKTTAVIGGSDSALTSALQLAEYSNKVYLIFRKDKPTALPAWIDKVENNPKIITIPKTNVLKITGSNKVEQIELDNAFQGEKSIKVDGVFIEIGTAPLSELVKPLGVKTDIGGFLITDGAQSTNIKGMYASGDMTTASNKFQQIITACSEGAIATNSVFRYLKTLK